MRFDALFERLLRRTGDYVDAPAKEKDADYRQILADEAARIWTAHIWPQLKTLTKTAVSLDENGAAYIEIPEGQLSAVYAEDPTLETTRAFRGSCECAAFNGRLYVPARGAYVWVESLPNPPDYFEDGEADVPDCIGRVAIEFALANVYEKRGEYDRANAKNAMAEKFLDEELFKALPLTQNKVQFHV